MEYLKDINYILTQDSCFLFNISNKLFYFKNHYTFSIFEDENHYILDFINVKSWNVVKKYINVQGIQEIYDFLLENYFIQQKFEVNY